MSLRGNMMPTAATRKEPQLTRHGQGVFLSAALQPRLCCHAFLKASAAAGKRLVSRLKKEVPRRENYVPCFFKYVPCFFNYVPCFSSALRMAVISVVFAAANIAAASALPAFVDNSKKMYFPPVIDQKGGSCAQASGIGYMFTYEINRLLGRDASASDANRFAYLFTWNFVNGGGDNGGFVDEGLMIARNFGVMTEADYGYASVYQFKWASGYEKYHNAARYRVSRITKFDDTTSEGIARIKQYLYDRGDGSAAGGVLTFSTRSSNWAIDNNYGGPSLTGYKSILTRLATEGAHAITIAGYDDTVESTDADGNSHTGAFIVVNTWGTWWSDNGRFYLPYYFFTNRNGLGESYLSSEMQGCDVYHHEPKVMYKIRLNYSSRDDLRLTFGAAASPYALSASGYYNGIIVSEQGGDYPMTGSFGSENRGVMELGLDYTDKMRSDGEQNGRYFLGVVRSQRGKTFGEGTIEYFSVIDYRGGKPVEYVCRGIGGRSLRLGSNNFSVSTLHAGHFTASPSSPLNADGSVSGKTFIVRTAAGRVAKLKFHGSRDKLGFNYTFLK